jgi:integrin alpha FG-GAP repeat containing protein 1
VTTKFYITDLDESYLPRTGIQLSQSSHLSLGLPYVMYGLGRTNNYIENFFMGFPCAKGSEHFSRWSGVIPNSQVIVFPYNEENPSSWKIELLISPSESAKYVIAALISTILVLGITIAYLHWKEKKEDQTEKKRSSENMFTF